MRLEMRVVIADLNGGLKASCSRPLPSGTAFNF